ncbi:MAG: hypothetical protein WD623_15705 [Marinobacter sp.]|uniref:hypothetical protein n=1 Tax=Marinobacter sp. TaxID=50741 RepID=UPI0034A05695
MIVNRSESQRCRQRLDLGDGDAHTCDLDGRVFAHSMPDDLPVLTYSVDSQITDIGGQ